MVWAVLATLAFVVVVVLATSAAKSVQKCECHCNSTVSAVQNFSPSYDVKTKSNNNIHEVEADDEDEDDEIPPTKENMTEKKGGKQKRSTLACLFATFLHSEGCLIFLVCKWLNLLCSWLF